MGILDHILETTRGDLTAAERRLDEIDDLLEAIADNPPAPAMPGEPTAELSDVPREERARL